ncbi:MAG: hypothetical protein V7K78_07250 [Nostoc sp.]
MCKQVLKHISILAIALWRKTFWFTEVLSQGFLIRGIDANSSVIDEGIKRYCQLNWIWCWLLRMSVLGVTQKSVFQPLKIRQFLNQQALERLN